MYCNNIIAKYVALIVFVASAHGCGSSSLSYPVLYVDLDGTALDSHHQVRPATIVALKEYQRRGGRVGIATGRIFEQAKKAIDVINPNAPIVLYNGGLVIRPTSFEVMRATYISNDDLDAIVSGIMANKSLLNGAVLHYVDRTIPIVSDPAFVAFAAKHGIALDPDSRPLHQRGLPPGSGGVIKVLTLTEPAKVESLITALSTSLSAHNVRVLQTSKEGTVEIIPKHVDKARAIQEGLESYGLTLNDVVAFGDSGNDVEMVAKVRLGIAMDNGHVDTKKGAVAVIGNNDTDAIARFIDAVLLK